MMAFRLCKISLVVAVGFFFVVVVLNNAVFDYRANYEFVRHVLSMDTLFSGESQAWRSFRDPTPADNSYSLHHALYWLLIGWEATTAGLCLGGAWQLKKHLHASADCFNEAKRLAVYGLTLSLLQWFTAFITIGAEWFLMWQSKTWNAQTTAFFLSCTFLLFLIHHNHQDD